MCSSDLTQTAGIVQGGYKFLLDPEAGDDTCKHYDGENPYPGEREELYALDSDPLELDNLRGDDPDRAESMRADLCQWLLASEWNGDGSDNPLLKTCER